MSQFNEVIAKIECFAKGQDISLSLANEIEAELAEIFDDYVDDIIDDFLHDLALYRPDGGELFFDRETFLPKAKFALNHLRHLNEKSCV